MSLVSHPPNPPTAVPYIYQPLGPLEIRLLVLAPGEPSDEIQVRLHHVDLQNAPDVDFEALSYVWGTPEPSQRVMVDAEGGRSQFLPVRDNLAGALRRIRDPTTPKALWVDALCLNQGDDEEKSQQVPFMAEIYRRAACVIVWLGPERDGSDSAMGMLRDLGEHAETNWTTRQLQHDDCFMSLFDNLRTSESARASIDRLLKRDWFGRVWVHQEV